MVRPKMAVAKPLPTALLPVLGKAPRTKGSARSSLCRRSSAVSLVGAASNAGTIALRSSWPPFRVGMPVVLSSWPIQTPAVKSGVYPINTASTLLVVVPVLPAASPGNLPMAPPRNPKNPVPVTPSRFSTVPRSISVINQATCSLMTTLFSGDGAV